MGSTWVIARRKTWTPRGLYDLRALLAARPPAGTSLRLAGARGRLLGCLMLPKPRATAIGMDIEYRGSPYHKRHPSQWGAPELRSDKTECPVGIDEAEIIRVFEEAIPTQIRRGWVSNERDGDWPRYVWGRSEFQRPDAESVVVVWEARVVNRGIPQYKAYPVQRGRHNSAMPPHVEEALWPA